MSLRVAISISTHNRLRDLEHTCEVIAKLSPQPDEVLVCADGCTDGTVDFLRSHHPSVRLFVHEHARGSILSRDMLIRQSTADVVVSLDDDSHPIERDFVERVLALFENMPRLAVASFPQRSDEFPETLEREDFGPSLFTGNYVNAAAAFRRSTYLESDGWDTSFEHMYDEPDYSLQCLANGWQIYHFTGASIRHHYSPRNRNEIAIHHRHARNEQWSAWRRCPFPQVVAVAAGRAIRQAGYAARRGANWLLREPQWWAKALVGLPRCIRTRQPAPWQCYREWIRLARQPIQTETEWEARFGRFRK